MDTLGELVQAAASAAAASVPELARASGMAASGNTAHTRKKPAAFLDNGLPSPLEFSRPLAADFESHSAEWLFLPARVEVSNKFWHPDSAEGFKQILTSQAPLLIGPPVAPPPP